MFHAMRLVRYANVVLCREVPIFIGASSIYLAIFIALLDFQHARHSSSAVWSWHTHKWMGWVSEEGKPYIPL